MIEFFINGTPVEVKIEDEQTIGDVLSSFERTCEENKVAVIGIIVNGKQITADIFDGEVNKPLEKNTKFEFTVVSENDIKASFIKLTELFNELAKKMEQIPVELQNGKNLEASNSIKQLADAIDQFCHIATLASLFPQTFKDSAIENMNFADFFADFSPVLKDFEDALKNNDTVMIGDLAEYEICPRLLQISKFLTDIQSQKK